jgi:predicted acyl esterase
LVATHSTIAKTSTTSVAKSRSDTMIEERDISVVMRDGTRLAVDVYRPDAPGKYPVLYASALHNKDIQGPDIADILPPQPAHAPLWFGPIEAGDTRRFIANGYVHVIAQPRGSAKSEGHYGHEDTDHYDLIEWMAGCRAGASRAESNLSIRRLQCVWRHVRIP